MLHCRVLWDRLDDRRIGIHVLQRDRRNANVVREKTEQFAVVDEFLIDQHRRQRAQGFVRGLETALDVLDRHGGGVLEDASDAFVE